LGRGFAWLDTGTTDSLAKATNFVRMIQDRQGIQISALEEIAYQNHWITKAQLEVAADLYGKSPYGQHLRRVAEDQVKHLK
jgi:glucose-1-phosphate thymidylyltransferase